MSLLLLKQKKEVSYIKEGIFEDKIRARNLLKAGLERPEEPMEASPLGEPMKQEAPAYA